MNSILSLLALTSGFLILGGACYLVATKRASSVLVAYLVLSPLPVLISVCDWMSGLISSLNAIASTPNAVVTTADIAAATADSLLGLLFAVLISVTTYLVLAISLLLRTLRFPTDLDGPNVGSTQAFNIAAKFG